MKLSAEGKLRLAVRLALTMGVGSIAHAAIAQEAPADPATAQAAPADAKKLGAVEVLGGVQVTGSRIKSVNLVSDSPVTTVNAAELKFQGTNRVEDLINNLPQAFAGQGGNLANGANGTATVDLRNIGPSRTLVLVDGKRLQPGTIGSPQADLNFIPAQLIERVEVLTGGASAIYGSDAVAGVVNFILKKEFEGVKIDYQAGGFLHDNDNSAIQGRVSARNFALPDKTVLDGGSHQVTLLYGVNSGDGKGNATLYGSYLQLDAVPQSERDFSACNLAASSNPSGFSCGGSGTPAATRVTTNGGVSSLTVDPATGNTFIPYVAGRDAFNFAPFNYFQRNAERYSLGGAGHYKIANYADAYAQVNFTDYKTDAVIAPSGIFFGNNVSLACNNPLLSPAQAQSLCGADAGTGRILSSNDPDNPFFIGRRNVEGGGRDSFFDRSAYRLVFGVKGDFASAFSYDTSVQYGTTRAESVSQQDFSITRINRALDVVRDPNTGALVCRSALEGTDAACVPYNIFQAGGVTPEALAYLQVPGITLGTTAEQVATGSVTGDFGKFGIKSPFATDGVQVSVGGEYRRETSSFQSDFETSTGDLAGAGGANPAFSGAFAVKELFAETQIPLLQHLPFIESLNLDAAYRYSDYNTTANITRTYKIGGSWAPTKDIRFRGGFNRAVRAPSINEIVNPTNIVLDGTSDPCAGQIAPGTDQIVDTATGRSDGKATRAQCLADPLIAANPGLYGNISDNSANQYNGQVGSSANLQSERSNTYTGGFAFTPTFVKNLNITVDYYSIKVNGLIGVIGADTILNSCYQNGALCNLIHRDPNTGSLYLGQNGFVIDTTQNTGSISVRGIDIAADYRFKLSEIGLGSKAGSVNINLVGTRDIKESHTPIPGDSTSTFECQGRYGSGQCGTPVPLWRHKLRATYSVPTPFLSSVATFSTQWRYISSVRADDQTFTGVRDARLGAQNYVDLSASISFYNSYTFRLGVNNVFDKDPPLVGSAALPGVTGNGNTFPQVYDSLGRFLFAGVTLDF